MVNTKIRLIIFFAVKNGEALYCQQKQDQELTVAQMVKNLPGDQDLISWVGKIPWRGEWQSTPVSFPGEFYEQRSLVGYSPWGHTESNMTE